MNVDEAISATAEEARRLLIKQDGKRKGHDEYLILLTFNSVLSLAASKPGLGQILIDWDGKPYLYDLGIALVWLEIAKKGDWIADRVLCKAAAFLLWETGTIADLRLRAYAAERLGGGVQITERRSRGRSAQDNFYRDQLIAFRLIPPLLRMGFHATRGDATKDMAGKAESACSIVCGALKRIGIHISEKRIEGIWGKFAPYSHQIGLMTSTQNKSDPSI